jgi:hypothetical protein
VPSGESMPVSCSISFIFPSMLSEWTTGKVTNVAPHLIPLFQQLRQKEEVLIRPQVENRNHVQPAHGTGGVR